MRDARLFSQWLCPSASPTPPRSSCLLIGHRREVFFFIDSDESFLSANKLRLSNGRIRSVSETIGNKMKSHDAQKEQEHLHLPSPPSSKEKEPFDFNLLFIFGLLLLLLLLQLLLLYFSSSYFFLSFVALVICPPFGQIFR